MSTLRTNTLQDAAGGSSVPMATVAAGTAKAWVNFNGTGTVAIRAAFNVSSITDNGTGNYTVNFTSAMPNTNYAVTIGGLQGSNGVNITAPFLLSSATSSCSVQQGTTGGGGGGATDVATFCVAIFS